ncbi:hypothetical protein UFOVP1020_42 [uncultured Caudovirales phage]|uniref:Glycosyltransferase n=1 Tax=uncultured Caudovirales phage TaxID=2100421 RepID=A0A6J5R044_9CAUD|nr:hypothetical protein UFOVP512_47 [uncultured Caudovirales phage]CAB4178701.1 hypothetical protein UFOVP1020_42 [uncultured Caudovirales phage]CAB4188056.1 hypothetical protein UFOVP1170_37 [uncultured Caudovirales phage]CAB4220279.1 hypothetical protein UFOVP1621_8 [uncultured Caudovirales phage]
MRVGPARSVRIAVPAYTLDSYVDDAQRSLAAGVMALDAAGIKIEDVDVLQGCCYLDHVRNVLAGRFMRGTATDMIFLDGDVGFEPESLLRLCQVTQPLVAGIYPKKKDPAEWPVNPMAGEIWSDAEGLIACEMVPTGFMRINRLVFEALSDVPTYAHEDGPLKAYFKTEVRDGEYWGEDVEFCRLWREAGGQIKAFAEMELRHTSPTQTYTGNWGQWLRDQMKMAA